MTHDSARQFVARMRMDTEFRQQVKSTPDTTAFRELLRRNGYDFSKQDLVGAMACCMEEMDTHAPALIPTER